MKNIIALFACLILAACGSTGKQDSVSELRNPILPGYFADPSIVEHNGKFYMYVTADPWGAEFLSCWESEDFQNWTFNKLNWPTKIECTSEYSTDSKVWAPSVIKKGNMFYMYISVGSEIWCGKAPHPLGPWENMLGDNPMIPYDTTRYYHVIDAEAFNDDDGKSYLYWGSGWDWKNGHCYAAELNDDMASFKTEPLEVTPTRYFEGPMMVKNAGKYYLTYSEGITMDDTYEVRYAVGDNPLGPFTEASNSPVLKTNEELQVYGPGHHTIFSYQDKSYILYHRHRLPFVTGTAMRQTCINELTFDEANTLINTIVPYNTQSFPNLVKTPKKYIEPIGLVAGTEQDTFTSVANVVDNSYGTRWEVDSNDSDANLIAIFEEGTEIKTAEIRFEYPWKKYFIKVEYSKDGENWEKAADYTDLGISGSPVLIDVNSSCQVIRISFEKWSEENKPSIWELRFY